MLTTTTTTAAATAATTPSQNPYFSRDCFDKVVLFDIIVGN